MSLPGRPTLRWRHKAFIGVLFLVTVSVSWLPARADESVVGAAPVPATLHFVNGDLLPGAPLDCDQAGALEWQGSAFTHPFRFDAGAIAEIRFPAPAVATAEAGEFRFDLSEGDVL